LLYGYGSKLNLVYDYLKYFQENINGKENDYHIMIFNCYNSDIKINFILGGIIDYLNNFKKRYISQNLNSNNNNNYNNNLSNNFINTCDGYLKTDDEKLKKINEILGFLIENDIIKKMLIVINNLDSFYLCNKESQKTLSKLFFDKSDKMHLFATTDSLFLNYFWNQTIKDNYSFYFLKFNTFENFDMEINDKNSLTGEKNIKEGMGLVQILRSLTKNQRDMIKIIAKNQLKGNTLILTLKNLTKLLIDEMIASSQNQVLEYLIEPIDHGLIVERKSTAQSYYKLNLSDEILNKFDSGEYDNLEG